MKVYAYLRASTEHQDATRATESIKAFAAERGLTISAPMFIENESGSRLDRPELFKLLEVAQRGDVMLLEAVDRLARLNAEDWENLRNIINSKGVKIVAMDLPTSWIMLTQVDEFTARMFDAINGMMLDMLAAIARKDYETRRERCKQGIEKAKAKGVKFGRRRNENIDRAAIAASLSEGLTYRAAAELHGVSIGTIQNVVSELRG